MTGKIKSVYTLEDLLAKMTAEAALRPKVTPLQDYPKVPGTKVEFSNINLFNDTLDKYYGTLVTHYEFLTRAGKKIGVEFHVESVTMTRNHSESLKNFQLELEQALGKPIMIDVTSSYIRFNTKTFSWSDDVSSIVQEMVDFITKTKDLFEAKFS